MTGTTLLEQAQGPLGLADVPVTVEGRELDLLPSPLPALPAMVAAVACSTAAASALAAARGNGAVAPVHVDARHVAVAAVSERHAARRGGAPAADLFAPLSRFWQTADGWLRLHANYTWHRERALRVLGSAEDPASVGAAVARWPGEELEEALAAAGALGAAVRTPEEWAEHEQRRAVADDPLVDVRVAGSAGRGLPRDPAAPASGVRVLDLTRVIAGPVATRTLAAWGADVLRLDPPALPELPDHALDTLPGKRSADLDLDSPSGRRRFEELLAAADVVVHGYRPGALARHGLDRDDLAERHPHLSVVELSAWGWTGPWASRRGFDSLVQCATGIAVLTADPASPSRPGVLPAQVLDHGTGYLAAAAAMTSLAGVAAGRPPQQARLSLARTAAWLVSGGGAPTPAAVAKVDPQPFLVELPAGPDGARSLVVGPPGRTATAVPRWERSTSLGADAPRWT